ncbi:hypothetical protein Bbelb_048980 [Branchiostoma belcheri]|nr:hypothetical protein Bbelb_048980 [Branchiostoma belcheri]
MTFQARYRGMLLLLAVGVTAILQSSATPEKRDLSVAEKDESFVKRLEELIDGQVGGDEDDTKDMMKKINIVSALYGRTGGFAPTAHFAPPKPQQPGKLTEQTVKKYAPKVWLAKDETYNPSSVAFHLQNVKVYNGNRAYSHTPSDLPTCSESCYMSSNQHLDKASGTLPFFRGEKVTSSYQPPVYAVAKQISPTTTDIFYWMFYPYNRGKRVCIGSHGLWSTPGTHTYKKILINEKLQDETSAGTAWDTWNNVLITMYRPDGGYTGSWTWLNFKGRWGNKKYGLEE